MAIDITGEWWRGESADDIADYLEELGPGGYPVHHVAKSICAACSDNVFTIELDPSSACARRTCLSCRSVAYMVDSDQYWIDDDEGEGPNSVVCLCGSNRFESAAGFNLMDDGEVRWVSIGIRCVQDGVLGCCADWKIRYGPSRRLLNLA